MYGYPKLKSVNEVRAVILKNMVNEEMDGIVIKGKVDLSRMPPCRSSLKPHLHHVNYKAAQLKRSHELSPFIPPATDHGWRKYEDDEKTFILNLWGALKIWFP